MSDQAWDTWRGGPLDWSVLIWTIARTCGSPICRFRPSFLSTHSLIVLNLMVYPISTIAMSIDLATLPSDKNHSMEPGLAVVCTPGSPSDAVRPKVPLRCSLGDCVGFIVRVRSVAIHSPFNQRHDYHSHWANRDIFRPPDTEVRPCARVYSAAPPIAGKNGVCFLANRFRLTAGTENSESYRSTGEENRQCLPVVRWSAWRADNGDRRRCVAFTDLTLKWQGRSTVQS